MENEQTVITGSATRKRKIGSILLYILLALLAVFVAFLIIGRMSGKTPFIGKYTALWVLTDSMENTENPKEGFPAKSYILIEKVDPKEIEEGDIITFYSSDPAIAGSLNTHRVMEVVGDHAEFRTKGDHNLAADRYTAKAEDVVGRYVRRLPVLSALGRLFLSGAGLVVVFVIIIAVTAAAFIPDIVKTNREKKAREQAEIDRRVKEEVEKLKEQDQSGNPPTE